jgi:6-phosphogluconolactonase
VFKVKFLLAGILLLGLAGATASLTGCGFFPPLPTNPTCTTTSDCTTAVSYMYIGNATAAAPAIAGLTLTTTTTPASGSTPASSTLALTGTAGSNYALPVVPTALAITPGNSYVYVGGLTGIYVYAVNTDFSITLQSTLSPVAAATYPVAMQVDPSGAYLLVLNFSTSTTNAVLGVYSIDSTSGALTSTQTFTLKTVGASQQMAISPASATTENVVATFSTGGIEAFTLNASTGALTDLGNIAPRGSGSDQGVAINPTSTNAFVTEVGSNVVRSFTISATTGGLTEVGTGFATGNGPWAALVDATGDFVYVANKTDGTISGYSLLSSGNLTALASSPFPTGTGPVGLVEDSTKSYIGAVCQGNLTSNTGGNPDVQIYSFDTTALGKLDKAGSATTGTEPTVANLIIATQ